MRRNRFAAALLTASVSVCPSAFAGQAPMAAAAPDIPISHRDRVYAAEQFSNTVSVIDPADNAVLGVIRLGEPAPANFSPLYRGQLLVHGMGFSPDHRTLAVVSIGSNSVTFIDTATNAVKHGIAVPNGPGMQIFSPDGKYGYVCSSFNPETDVISVASHAIVGRVRQASPFCPNIAASADGTQVWFTLKDVGQTQVFDARPPFALLKTLDTGPITNHVNLVRNAHGSFAYVTVGGLNEVQVFDTTTFARIATIPVGRLPHGVWPSGDGTRVYVGLENGDAMTAIDTLTNKVIATMPIGQAPQAVAYVPDAVPEGAGTQNLQPLGIAGMATHLVLSAVADGRPQQGAAPTSVTLFDQGLLQVLQASVTGLQPKQPYVLALAGSPSGAGPTEPLASFVTNPAGSAIVDAVGPIRAVVQGTEGASRRYLVILAGGQAAAGSPVQVQSE